MNIPQRVIKSTMWWSRSLLEEHGKEGTVAGKWAEPNGERRRAKASTFYVLSSLGLSQNPHPYSYSHLTKIASQPPWSGADSSCGRPIPTTKRWCSPAFSERSPSFGQGLYNITRTVFLYFCSPLFSIWWPPFQNYLLIHCFPQHAFSATVLFWFVLNYNFCSHVTTEFLKCM